jgi:hypothetical protein
MISYFQRLIPEFLYKKVGNMSNIIIREADGKDVEGIYDLFAGEGLWQSTEHIVNNIDNYTVLQYDDQMVAVLCSKFSAANAGDTIAVHPGYPQSIIAESVHGLLQGIAQRQAALNYRMNFTAKDKPLVSRLDMEKCCSARDMRIV